MRKLLLLPAFLLSFFVNAQDSGDYRLAGRTFEPVPGEIHLVGAASSVTFYSDLAEVPIRVRTEAEKRAYIVIEVDDVFQSRREVSAGPERIFKIKAGAGKPHKVTIYKASEAVNGDIVFLGTPKRLPLPEAPVRKRIEFIGNSITSGFGNDYKYIPCDKGEWYDQHNAYYSYAPILSRTLDADFRLSSVSGIGIYRNWNDEHDKEATMPEVYANLNLTKTDPRPVGDFFVPDVVSIALGTNDFSDGDKKTIRQPFQADKFTAAYIAFVKTVRERYPQAKIILLNSPMLKDEKNKQYVKCLKKVVESFQKDGITISLFEFPRMEMHGCGGHPDIEDDKYMAAQLEATFRSLLEAN